MPHRIRSFISASLLAVVAVLCLSSLVLPASAGEVDSHVIINISTTSGPVPTYVKFTTTQHGLGTCSTGSGAVITVWNGSLSCNGEQFGPMELRLYEAPSGYKLNSFSGSGSVGGVGYGCSSYCYLNFTSGTVMVNVNFSPLPPAAPAPAAPAAPATTTTSNTGTTAPAAKKKTTTTTKPATPATTASVTTSDTSSASTTRETLAATTPITEEVADTVSPKPAKTGLNNLEKIVIGLIGVGIVAALTRYIYLRSDKSTNYWS